MTYISLPQELRELSQWVVWRLEQRDDKATKVPYDPTTGQKASATDPTTWCSFDTAVSAVSSHDAYNGIGFMFSATDPYVGVDLDVNEGQQPSDTQQYVYNKLITYAEYSPSGRGVHIIARGSVPKGRNNREFGIEVYSKDRFFTMTGNVLRDAPIADHTTNVYELWQEMGGVYEDDAHGDYTVQHQTDITDVELVKRVCGATRVKAYYNWVASFDWSSAYRAVLGAACLFSGDEAQVRRVVLASPLVTDAPAHGHETRPRRVERLWAKEYGYAARHGDVERGDAAYRMWSNMWYEPTREKYAEALAHGAEVALAIIASHTRRVVEAGRAALDKVANPRAPLNRLPVQFTTAGMMTDSDLELDLPADSNFSSLIDAICARTRNPSPIMAMWAVLGFVSGAVGRAYELESGQGVNAYLILSAGTNTGKTQHSNALYDMVSDAAPRLMSHVHGGDIASAQMLAKAAQESASMVLQLPDAGAWLEGVISARTAAQAQMKSAILNVYEAAGRNKTWAIPKSIRAANDKNENIDEFNMSIMLDTTPQFIDTFEIEDFTNGLVSRFLIVHGPTVISQNNRNRATGTPPRVAALLTDLYNMYIGHSRPSDVNAMQHAVGIPQRVVIRYEDEALRDYHLDLDDESTDITRRIQSGEMPSHYIAASRVVLNAVRIAGTVAIIENPAQPTITRSILDWSLRFVLRSVTHIIREYNTGAMGSEESKQEAAIIDFVVRYLERDEDALGVTLGQLGQYVDKLACFSKAKLGARATRTKVLEDMVARGVIEKHVVVGKTKPTTVYTFGGYDT